MNIERSVKRKKMYPRPKGQDKSLKIYKQEKL